MNSNRIGVLRAVKGINQKQFAATIDVNYTTVSNWERGHSKPSRKQLQKISDIYNVSLAWLIDDTPVKIPKPGRSNTIK